ncbi:hypothetical protein RhiirA5_436985, partial [Rhizophagus irregularis]
DIKNDFAKMKDMMDCMFKEQASMRNELNIIKVHGNVVFNSNNKRTRNEESSGSDSNAANNIYLLSNRMNQADDTMKI